MSKTVVRQAILAVVLILGFQRHEASAQGIAGPRLSIFNQSVAAKASTVPPIRVSVAARKSEWRRGMLVGGVIGAGAGAAYGLITNGQSDNSSGAGYVLMSAVIVGALFAVVGGLIGSGIHR